MSGAFNMPRHRRRLTISVTPLIDVMFLLLIFVMVSSTFKESPGIDISLPQADSGTGQDLSAHEVVVDRDGQFYSEGKAVDDGGLSRSLRDLLTREPNATVVLRADKEADFGRVVRAMDIARTAGAENLIIPTNPSPVLGSEAPRLGLGP